MRTVNIADGPKCYPLMSRLCVRWGKRVLPVDLRGLGERGDQMCQNGSFLESFMGHLKRHKFVRAWVKNSRGAQMGTGCFGKEKAGGVSRVSVWKFILNFRF